MPRKKKTARDMTSEEIAHKVFPPKVLKELKKQAQEADSKPRSGPKPKGNTSP